MNDYPYEPEWFDPSSTKLNKRRWIAVNRIADAWRTLDPKRFSGILHKDFRYYSELRPNLIYNKTQYLREKREQFKQLTDPFVNFPVIVNVVSIYRGPAKLEYPYGINLYQRNHPEKATILLLRFCGDKISEILAADPLRYAFTHSIPKGLIRYADGKPDSFTFFDGRSAPGNVATSDGMEYFTVHTAFDLIRATGENIVEMSCANDPNIPNIVSTTGNTAFACRIDSRYRCSAKHCRRVCGRLDRFVESIGTIQKPFREFLVITIEPISDNGIPISGDSFNIFVNEAVHIIKPKKPKIKTTRQWREWLNENDAYLLNISKQADNTWREDKFARPAPVALIVEQLPIPMQKGLLAMRHEKYHAHLAKVGHWLLVRAEAVGSHTSVKGLKFEAKRLIRMSKSRRGTM